MRTALRLFRRAAVCLLAAAMLLSLSACGSSKQEDEPLPDDGSQVEDINSEEPGDTPAGPAEEASLPDEESELEASETSAKSSGYSQEALDQKVSEVLASIISDGMTKLQQARAVFDYVHSHIYYTGSSDKSNWKTGAYAGLTTGRGDCFTYYAVSRALLTALDIDNLEVQRVGGATHHYWNLVNCGDGWYHFDACPRSLKMPSFTSFMVTDQQVADYTAMAGRNYYDFDGSLLPERATTIINPQTIRPAASTTETTAPSTPETPPEEPATPETPAEGGETAEPAPEETAPGEAPGEEAAPSGEVPGEEIVSGETSGETTAVQPETPAPGETGADGEQEASHAD